MTASPNASREEAAPQSCPQCRNVVDQGMRFCTNCGAGLLADAASAATAPARARTRLDALGEWLPVPALPARETAFAHAIHILALDPAAAAAALGFAVTQGGDEPSQAVVLAALGVAEARSGAKGRALKALLDAALVDPGCLTGCVGAAFEVLSEEAVAVHGEWIVDHWRHQVDQASLSPADRATTYLLVAAVRLLRGERLQALAAARLAGDSDRNAAAELATVLAPLRLPAAVARDEVERGLLFGRLAAEAGDDAGALSLWDRALLDAPSEHSALADVHEARADVLARLNRFSEAARSLMEAARAQTARESARASLKTLERAAAMDPRSADTSWSLAEARRLASYDPAISSAERAALLHAARSVWQDGFAVCHDDGLLSYGYAVYAAIAERSAEVMGGEAALASVWEAVAFAERAIVRTPDDVNRRAELARHLRRVGLQGAALAAAEHAAAPAADGQRSSKALEEVVIALTNLGRWDDAVGALAVLEELDPTPWNGFVAARLALYRGELEAALVHADTAVRRDPREMHHLETRGLVLRRLGRHDEARDIAHSILAQRNGNGDEPFGPLITSALEAGDTAYALELAGRRLERLGAIAVDRAGILQYRAIALLMNDQLGEARDEFVRGLAVPPDPESRWLLLALLDDVKVWTADHPRATDLHAALAALGAMVEPLRLDAEIEPDPRPAVRRAVAEAASETWCRIGTLATLARLETERGDLAAAATCYAELEADPARFPEAALKLDTVIVALNEREDLTDYWRRRDNPHPPSSWMARALDRYLPSRLKMNASAADTAALASIVEPVAVELHSSLLPIDAEDELPLLRVHLPKLRERIEAETGLTIPGVRLRQNEWLEPGHFGIRLTDAWVLVADCRPGWLYVLAPRSELSPGSAIPDDAIEEETSGPDAGLACWVRAEHAAALAATAVPVLVGPHAYVARRLEAVLRSNLVDLLGIDEADALLLNWAERFGRADEIEALRTGPALARITQLMRRLLRDGLVPFDAEAILDAVAKGGLVELAATQRHVRLRQRERLPGNGPGHRHLPLAPEMEAECAPWRRDQNGRSIFAMPPETTQDLLTSIRERAAGKDDVALIVVDPHLRPHIADLARLEFPDLAVLAEEEALPRPGATLARRRAAAAAPDTLLTPVSSAADAA